MLECVEAAVKKVIELGYADAKRIGVNGHSYGGEGAAYIATHSKMFAAVGMGAGVTDLTSDFTHNWGWSYTVTGGSGANGFNYYIYALQDKALTPPSGVDAVTIKSVAGTGELYIDLTGKLLHQQYEQTVVQELTVQGNNMQSSTKVSMQVLRLK